LISDRKAFYGRCADGSGKNLKISLGIAIVKENLSWIIAL
jgi:hypothetical protein